MAGRFVHFLVAGAAIVAGMAVQGDIDLGMHPDDREIDRRVDRIIGREVDRTADRTVDRIVDRATDKIEIRGRDGETVEADPATRRALAAAVAELVRAEGSLAVAKVGDNMPETVIEQAEQRRNLARKAVERIADDARAEARRERDARPQKVRDEVRDAVRSAVRS